MNLIDACIDKRVKRIVSLSTDKASSPANLYGATKLTSDRLFVSGNSYSGSHDTCFSVVRYGNVMGSRGSVIPFFLSIKDEGNFPITDERMTRFMISLEEGVELVWHAFDDMKGGEIYIKKIPSMKITDIAKAISKEASQEIVGIRPGEKLHEQMIGFEDAPYTHMSIPITTRFFHQLMIGTKIPKGLAKGLKWTQILPTALIVTLIGWILRHYRVGYMKISIILERYK